MKLSNTKFAVLITLCVLSIGRGLVTRGTQAPSEMDGSAFWYNVHPCVARRTVWRDK